MRKYTNRLLDYIDGGNIDTTCLAHQLLMWLSEDDVKQFYYDNGYADLDEEQDDD